MRAIVLLSGGLDSTTILRIAQEKGYEIYALTFNYGQKHLTEIEAAKAICEKYGVKNHCIANIDMKAIGGSALTDDALSIKKDCSVSQEIPLTYVPARNTIFLSYALGYAEVVKASKIFIGINAIDYSGYPDCRPEYLEKFNALAKIATAVGVKDELCIEVEAPLIKMSKADIIKEGLKLGIDYRYTISCYDVSEEGIACGKCDACTLRLQGFKNNKIQDPIKYL
jgi:7-cyano-7-deazaguanine synthase